MVRLPSRTSLAHVFYAVILWALSTIGTRQLEELGTSWTRFCPSPRISCLLFNSDHVLYSDNEIRGFLCNSERQRFWRTDESRSRIFAMIFGSYFWELFCIWIVPALSLFQTFISMGACWSWQGSQEGVSEGMILLHIILWTTILIIYLNGDAYALPETILLHLVEAKTHITK